LNNTNADLFNLSGQVAVVTGAGGILGRDFCRTLSEHGCKVAAIDKAEVLESDNFKTFHDEIKDSLEVYPFSCDITSPGEIELVVKNIENDLGNISILHNNAATKTSNLENFFKKYEDYDLATWREVMSVNIDSMFLMSQAVGSRMIQNGIRGSIIQTSSIYGLVGPHGDIYSGSEYLGMQINTPAVYSASKAAVVGLTKYLATYWGTQNIRVNCLVPGGISSGQNETFTIKYSELVPLGRMGNASELQSALLFLASEASSYVTGQNLIVDGGFTSW
jgi:NAD(P)-dependent dehydrogenase (short-subunit alcohol dehydrogenase family)